MEDEPEMIRQRMEETRTSLSEQLEALETHVATPVSNAVEAVADTVESVKESVQSIKDTFDLSTQFERRPGSQPTGTLGQTEQTDGQSRALLISRRPHHQGRRIPEGVRRPWFLIARSAPISTFLHRDPIYDDREYPVCRSNHGPGR